jgi:hypothetical protein
MIGAAARRYPVARRGWFTDDAGWERRAAAAGVIFVVLALTWVILRASGPGGGDSHREIVKFFSDSGDRERFGLSGWVMGAAGLFLLWFLSGLRTLLRRAEAGDGRLASLAFGGGIVMTALLFAKNSIHPAFAGVYDYADDFKLDPNTYQLLDSIWFWLIAQEFMAGAVLVAATSAIALRTGLFPRWFGWAGVIVAALNFLAIPLYLAPGVLLVAWFLVASVLMWLAAPRAAPVGG